MKITLLFLLIALIAITALVKAEVDEDFETGIEEGGIEDRELYYWYWPPRKKSKKGDGKSNHAPMYILSQPIDGGIDSSP